MIAGFFELALREVVHLSFGILIREVKVHLIKGGALLHYEGIAGNVFGGKGDDGVKRLFKGCEALAGEAAHYVDIYVFKAGVARGLIILFEIFAGVDAAEDL